MHRPSCSGSVWIPLEDCGSNRRPSMGDKMADKGSGIRGDEREELPRLCRPWLQEGFEGLPSKGARVAPGGGIQKVDRRGAGGGFQLDGRVVIIQGCQGRCLPLGHEDVCHVPLAPSAGDEGEAPIQQCELGLTNNLDCSFGMQQQCFWISPLRCARQDCSSRGLLIAGSGVVGCAMARLGRSESLICVALLRLLILAGVAWVGGVISGLFGGGSRLSSDERHVMESDMWATAGFDGAAVSADPVANVESVGAAGGSSPGDHPPVSTVIVAVSTRLGVRALSGTRTSGGERAGVSGGRGGGGLSGPLSFSLSVVGSSSATIKASTCSRVSDRSCLPRFLFAQTVAIWKGPRHSPFESPFKVVVSRKSTDVVLVVDFSLMDVL
ncbi:hypothetical protein D5F01_LYC06638 [Larimichthys crocea]|uniref:Uncharacterized protein n=1 Tax=Larimichthys crocea TaxID=215358 RepID=A0A6G0IWP2_LARCR|nr:hypothetical protein D5F01_LYC06638 [Larimichthys crocea]